MHHSYLQGLYQKQRLENFISRLEDRLREFGQDVEGHYTNAIDHQGLINDSQIGYANIAMRVTLQTEVELDMKDFMQERPVLIGIPQNLKFGYVYCISNEILHAANIYKIGFTRHSQSQNGISSLFERIARISKNTTNPYRFDIKCVMCVFCPDVIEKIIHEMLEVYRINGGGYSGKEFFRVKLEKIRQVFRFIAQHYNGKLFVGNINFKDFRLYPQSFRSRRVTEPIFDINKFPLPSLRL